MIEYPEGRGGNYITLDWCNPSGFSKIWGMKCQKCNSACVCVAVWEEGMFYRCTICHKGALWKK